MGPPKDIDLLTLSTLTRHSIANMNKKDNHIKNYILYIYYFSYKIKTFIILLLLTMSFCYFQNASN